MPRRRKTSSWQFQLARLIGFGTSGSLILAWFYWGAPWLVSVLPQQPVVVVLLVLGGAVLLAYAGRGLMNFILSIFFGE